MAFKEQFVLVANASNIKKKKAVYNVAQKILIGHHWMLLGHNFIALKIRK